MKILDLNDSPWTLAYVRVVQALKNDPVLKTTIHPQGWNTFLDQDTTDAPLGEDTLPALQVLPFGTGATSESPISQYSPLGISVYIATEGIDVRDLLNLWYAVHSAIFTGGGDRSLFSLIRSDFQVAGQGAQLEMIQLSMPAITPAQSSLDNQTLTALGSITLNIRVKK